MMQATKYRGQYDLSGLHPWVGIMEPVRHTLLDALMRLRAIVVISVASDNAVQLALIEDKHLVKAFTLEAGVGPFADGVGFWSADRRPENLDVTRLCDPVEGCL